MKLAEHWILWLLIRILPVFSNVKLGGMLRESGLIERAKEKGTDLFHAHSERKHSVFVPKLFKELPALKASGEKSHPEMLLFPLSHIS